MAVCTLPVNLQDCAPFASVHAAGLTADQTAAWDRAYQAGARAEESGRLADALAHFEEAAAIDNGFAELAFRQGRCLLALGRGEPARQQFLRARDLDAMRFRADTTINATVRSLAGADVHLVDGEAALAAGSPSGVPGAELFFEHVHMTFRGNYLLAGALFRTITQLLPVHATAAGPDLLSEAECTERLAYVSWNRYQADAVIGPMLHQPPFDRQLDNAGQTKRLDARLDDYRAHFDVKKAHEELAVYATALKAAPGDWMIRENYGKLLADCGDAQDAAAQYDLICKQMPHHYLLLKNLASLRLRFGDRAGARSCLEAALQIDPDFTAADYELAHVLAADGQLPAAIARFAARVNREADRAEALAQFAQFLLEHDRPAEAGDRLRDALAINPDSPAAHLTMGELLAKQGATGEAITHYETAARLRPRYLPHVTKQVTKLRQAGTAK